MTSNHFNRSRSLALLSGIVVATFGGIAFFAYQTHRLLKSDDGIRTIAVVKVAQVKKPNSATLLSKPWSVSFVENRQRNDVKSLMADRQNAQALSAAKGYYNVAELRKTDDAVKLMTTVLTRTRGRTTAERFKHQQDPLSAIRSEATIAVPQVSILQTINLDSACFESSIQQLQTEPEDFTSMMACGNLLLLADRPRDARICFETALQIANAEKIEKPERTVATLEGIARTIRDQDGNAQRADAFILSFRRKAADIATTSSDCPLIRIRAAALKVKTSGLFNINPSESFQFPEDPSATAAADPKLASWLGKWQATAFSETYVHNFKNNLLDLLRETHLPCLALISTGRVISFHSSNDWTAAAFYAAGAVREHEEFPALAGTSVAARQILVGLCLAKPTIWRVVDGGDIAFVDALYTLNCDLSGRIPVDDSKLQNARVHGFIGAAECLWLGGKNDEALRSLGPLEKLRLTAEQARAAAWIRGLVFLSLHRYSDATPQFQIVAHAAEYTYTENAWRWLVVCLARTGNADDANKVFDSWVRRYHPDVKIASRVLELMGGSDSPDQRG